MKVRGISVFNRKPIEVKIKEGFIENINLLPGSGHNLPYISPGFFDLQVNGYKGNDYGLEDFSEEHLRNIITSLASSGTTQHIPTIISSTHERILKNLEIISKAINTSPDIKEAIPGIHIEGPFISSEEGPRGCHDPSFIRNPDFEEFKQWQEVAEGRIVMVTIAPEREGSMDFIKKVTLTGVRIAIGHTGAAPEIIKEAIEAGAQFSTHLGNGSYLILPKVNNYIWEQLAADKLFAGIICDGFHLPASAVKVFTRAKGLERLILTSDVALAGGLNPGIYKWGNMEVEVFKDGHLDLAGTGILAGAGHLLDWDIAHFIRFTGNDLTNTIPLCTINPAKVIGMPHNYGKLKVGAPANLTLFHYQTGDDSLQIVHTLCKGSVIF
ncbi:N-acetylglucosamine-6-phosphate deacetylase [subsurface metagenome]|jgi:N-acetylglucosamine-6-phosphate deacetylase